MTDTTEPLPLLTAGELEGLRRLATATGEMGSGSVHVGATYILRLLSDLAAARTEAYTLREGLRTILYRAGYPDPAEACRLVIALAKELTGAPDHHPSVAAARAEADETEKRHREELERWKQCVYVTRGDKAQYWGERNLLRQVLAELVALKDLKEQAEAIKVEQERLPNRERDHREYHRITTAYESRKPAAWERARALLANTSPTPAPVEEEKP